MKGYFNKYGNILLVPETALEQALMMRKIAALKPDEPDEPAQRNAVVIPVTDRRFHERGMVVVAFGDPGLIAFGVDQFSGSFEEAK